MLTREEIVAFLTLLLEFSRATGASGRVCGEVFQVSPNKMCRWLRLAPDGDGIQRMYWSRIATIDRKIKAMNEHDRKYRVYPRIAGIVDKAEKRRQIENLISKIDV